MKNLTNLLRPTTLDEFIGQTHIISPEKALYKLIIKKEIPHLFFYGKPGTGKTTLAKIIATQSGNDFYYFNATSVKIEEFRNIFKRYENALVKPLIFIDEVHRLNKTQQEVLLPIMENYSAIIIGASTENPFFTLTNAIRSRSFLYKFHSLTYDELKQLLNKALKYLDISIENESFEYIVYSSNGDARALLNLVDFACAIDPQLSLSTLKQLRNDSVGEGVSSSTTHYDLASALIKSLRGSDINAALYYLARIIEAGETVEFITRRLVIFASEDIGNANPNALQIATSTMISCNKIGFPEAKIILSQCIVYLASSPKSNSSYKAINRALDLVKNGKILNIPSYIKDSAKDYKNPHNFNGWCEQKYLTEDLKLYLSNHIAFEKTLDEWITKIKGDENGIL